LGKFYNDYVNKWVELYVLTDPHLIFAPRLDEIYSATSDISSISATLLSLSSIIENNIFAIKTVTTSYTATIEDTTLICNPSIEYSITATLPSVTERKGKIFNIKNFSDTYPIVIKGKNLELIDDDESLILDCKGTSVTLKCDETQWYII